MNHSDIERELHRLVAKYKIIYVPYEMRHNDDAILLPQGVVRLREGFNIVDGHIIHIAGVNESTWDKYGVALFGERVVMDLSRARSLEYDSGSRTLKLFTLPMSVSRSPA